MKLSLLHLLAALAAAVAFCLSFITASVVALSLLFMLAGLVAMAWLARSLIRQTLRDAQRQGR